MGRLQTPRGYESELLRRVFAAGLCERFTFVQVCPTDANKHLAALEGLIEIGFAERVIEGVGRWHLRLTAAGKEATSQAKSKKQKTRKKARNTFSRTACRKPA